MMNKLCASLSEAIKRCGVCDGMRLAFHHSLRNGDYVLNTVLQTLSELGIRGLTINTGGIFPVHEPLIEHIKSGLVTSIEADYISGPVAKALSAGLMDSPVVFRSHGGRAGSMYTGETPVDVAFVAASASDPCGNCTGSIGQSAFGSMGYAMSDAAYAKQVVVVTDDLLPYPLRDFSVPECEVDCVVCVEQIGDPQQISSGTTKMTRDPIAHIIAKTAADAAFASGLVREGFNFQTGAGGATLAAAMYLKQIMERERIRGGCCIGGMTGYMTKLIEAELFESLLDVQCFDLEAVRDLAVNPKHREISGFHYAAAAAKSCAVDSLDVVLLGATQIDTDFNVNVHTDSFGGIMGGSGGHCDAASGAKLTMILTPLIRHRIPIVVEKALCVSTPGSSVDMLVTQYGVAVNPKRPELREKLSGAGFEVRDIRELKELAESISGVPDSPRFTQRVIATLLDRDSTPLGELYTRA